jgi:hypothetical protein
VLRSGLDSLAAVKALEGRGCKAVLHGSMIEMPIQSFANQQGKDLLNNITICLCGLWGRTGFLLRVSEW